jgi:hypothetical protein
MLEYCGRALNILNGNSCAVGQPENEKLDDTQTAQKTIRRRDEKGVPIKCTTTSAQGRNISSLTL